ncbi:hypothetical protein IE53DRAFT_125897 [Violaceomyces palustris]|uniref:Uncharacterized protein n=1 Tax=Violaceomyces palustris TaxID=1673888 RepID=A0ACD0P695_9BASI|nr:hypothetical protein IE53DRAFT_125897 [Violaceomyces palustris]
MSRNPSSLSSPSPSAILLQRMLSLLPLVYPSMGLSLRSDPVTSSCLLARKENENQDEKTKNGKTEARHTSLVIRFRFPVLRFRSVWLIRALTREKGLDPC